MKNAIKRSDRKGHSNYAQAERDTRICPPTEFVPDIVEDEAGGTALCKYYQGGDRHNEENNMADTSNHLQSVQHAAEPEIPCNGDDNKSPHDESSVPSLRFVVGIVEDGKTGDDVGEIGGRSGRCCHPRPYRDPSLSN